MFESRSWSSAVWNSPFYSRVIFYSMKPTNIMEIALFCNNSGAVMQMVLTNGIGMANLTDIRLLMNRWHSSVSVCSYCRKSGEFNLDHMQASWTKAYGIQCSHMRPNVLEENEWDFYLWNHGHPFFNSLGPLPRVTRLWPLVCLHSRNRPWKTISWNI